MMILRAVIFSILVSVLFYPPTILGQHASGSNRWGIVTKEPVSDKASPPDESSQVEEIKGAPVPVNPQDSGKSPQQDPPDPKKENDSSVNPASEDVVKGTKNKQPSEAATGQSPSTGKNEVNKKPSAASKEPKTTNKEIKWTSESQKSTCQNYLQQLRDQFLKTRHYSIQGVPCKTADHAEAFLQLADKCDNECPEGLVEKSGYTGRIMRNIKFLEKLGNDKCSDNLPVTKTSPKAPSETPRPKN